MFHPIAHYAALAATRAADARHEAVMQRVCDRAGITVNAMRAMSRVKKDRFFATYGDAAQSKPLAAE